MTGKVQDMAPCLNKRVELDNCFLLMLFLMCYSISFLLFAFLNSAYHVDIIFILFTLQSWVKLIHIKNETWIFVLFNQQTQSLFTNTMFFFSFYVSFQMHVQTRCASSNDFSVLMVLIQCLFWFIHNGFFYTLLKSLLASCRSFLPCSTHTYTPFSNTMLNKMECLKSENLYNVTTDWWKLVKKSIMKWKKSELCGYLQ